MQLPTSGLAAMTLVAESSNVKMLAADQWPMLLGPMPGNESPGEKANQKEFVKAALVKRVVQNPI